MIRHHPTDATLIAQAAGSLTALHARVLTVHLAACPRCRDELHGMEDVGGALLAALPAEPLRPDALERTLARLDEPAKARVQAEAAAKTASKAAAMAKTSPAPLEGLGREADQGWGEGSLVAPPSAVRTPPPNPLPGEQRSPLSPAVTLDALATGRWWWLGPGIRLMPLARRDASGTRLDLIRVAPGVALPGHGHTGAEMACILQGGYADETGDYGVWDIAEGDPTLEHTPIASSGPDCICLIATTGRLRAHTWLARLVQPLIGV